MEFSAAEALFYALAFITAGAACFARILRDDERIVSSVIFGRCLSSGFFSFGAVAIWVGRDPDAGSYGGFYWLAIAALIGYLSRDIQDQVLTRATAWLLKKTGPPDGK